MKFIDRLKTLFGMVTAPVPEPAAPVAPRRFIKDQATGIAVETNDEIMAKVVAQAFTTGKVVIANRQPDGTVKINTTKPDGPV